MDIKENSKEIYALKLLANLFSPTSIKSKKSGDHYRPTKHEMSQGFILFLTDGGHIRPHLEERQEKLKRHKLTCQPIPIIVGPTLHQISASYVSINDTLYKVETPLKAVDITFKILHVLDAKYSADAEIVWTFIQKYIYELETVYDKSFVSVSSLIGDLSRY